MTMNLLNAGLYIHIPFCNSKCPYCDFFSVVPEDDSIKQKYLKALQKEIEIYGHKIPNIVIQSIYIGGGTPTTLSAIQIAEIIQSCYRHFTINKDIEITIESNPASFHRKKAVALLKLGINRLSLGAQSLNNRVLKKIGRIHNKKDILYSFHIAREAGFTNINLDIIFGLPGQTLRCFERTLEEIFSMVPEHVSLYSLSIEKGTIFERLIKTGLLKIPSDDLAYKMYQKAIDFLTGVGYEHYEISNFALAGHRCVHNQIYWKNQPYLGLGASSTSYIDYNRFQNYSNLNHYIDFLEYGILPIKTKEVLPEKEKIAETVILQLRMMEGLLKRDFIVKFKKPIEEVFPEQLKRLREEGLLDVNESRYFLTKKGIALANLVFLEFLE